MSAAPCAWPDACRPTSSITLVSVTNRFIERIRLHQRATGQNVGDWSLPGLIRGTGVQLRVGVIEGVDYGNRVLQLGGDRIGFDTLVLALGSHVDVDSVKGVREHAMAVEFGSVSDIHRALQKAAARSGRVTIVGGGLTGIELASEIAESFSDLQVSLVTQTRLAESWSEAARVHALASLRRLGSASRRARTSERFMRSISKPIAANCRSICASGPADSSVIRSHGTAD